MKPISHFLSFIPFVRILCVTFKQLYLHTHWKLDTCLYELIYSKYSILLPPKIFTVPSETPCILHDLKFKRAVGFANINHVFLIIVTIYGCYFPCHTPQWHLKTTAFQTASATLHFALPATVMATFSYWRQVKMITNYNQQDATFLECIYFYRCSTCFRQFLRSSSGAHNCTYSFRYCQAVCIVICSWWWAEEPPETCRAI